MTSRGEPWRTAYPGGGGIFCGEADFTIANVASCPQSIEEGESQSLASSMRTWSA